MARAHNNKKSEDKSPKHLLRSVLQWVIALVRPLAHRTSPPKRQQCLGRVGKVRPRGCLARAGGAVGATAQLQVLEVQELLKPDGSISIGCILRGSAMGSGERSVMSTASSGFNPKGRTHQLLVKLRYHSLE